MKVQNRRITKSATGTPDTQIFCRLSKVDVVNRMVYGRAVQEVPDASGEIFDYKSSKPYFEAWVKETKEATAGKSLGNIRAMHGNTAAGKATEVTFQDDECAIDIGAKIVDDNEWLKVQEGVYTGFSIGGNYVGEKRKDGELMRYTASPIEISLVDKPCIPTAMFFDIVKSKGFTVIKADGVEQHTEFKAESLPGAGDGTPDPAKTPAAGDPAPSDPVVKEPAADDETEIDGTPEEAAELQRVLKIDGMSLGKVVTMVKAALKAEAPKRFADAAKSKYPLDNDQQVLAAWYFVNTAKAAKAYTEDELKTIKAVVVEAFTDRFGKSPEAVDDAAATKALSGETLAKSFWSVASAANMLSSLAYFMGDCEYYEGCGEMPAGAAAKVMVAMGAMGDCVTMILNAAIAESKDEVGIQLMRKQLDVLQPFAKTDASRIQKGIEVLTEFLPKEMAKLTGLDTAAMQKALDAATAPLLERLAKIEAQPRPGKAVLRVVDKSKDGTSNTPQGEGPEIDPILDRDGNVDMAATAIKAMHANTARIKMPAKAEA